MKTISDGAPQTPVVQLATAKALLGHQLGPTEWRPIDQRAIDAYAALTGDDDWVHTDPARAAGDSPFGGETIVQGSFLLGHLAAFKDELAPRCKLDLALAYGLNRVRFVRPVPVGRGIRGNLTMRHLRPRGNNRYVAAFDALIEAEGVTGPAVVAEWLALTWLTT